MASVGSFIRSRSSNTSAHFMLVLSHRGEHNANTGLDVEKRQSTISFCSGHWSPMTNGSLLAADVGSWPAYTPLAAKQKDAAPLPHRDSSGGGHMPHDAHAYTEKRRTCESEAGKDISR